MLATLTLPRAKDAASERRAGDVAAVSGVAAEAALSPCLEPCLPRKRCRSGRAGVTLVELTISLVIAAVLVSLGAPMLQGVVEHARVARAIGDIQALQLDIATYEADGNGLPQTLGDIGRADLEDPWGNPYRYLDFGLDEGGGGGKGKGRGPPPQGARKDRFLVPINSSYDLYSIGKDGGTVPPLAARVSRDDIVRANDGGFIGLAEKY